MGQDPIERFDICGPITSSKHQMVATYVERLGMQLFGSLKKVAFVRNPFDRAMSYYFSPHRWVELRAGELISKTPRFDRDSFIKAVGQLRPMVEYLRVEEEVVPMDFLGRFECFEADVARAMEFLGIVPEIQLPHVNQSAVENRCDFYDGMTLGFVRKRFADDFQIFGYRPDRPV